MARKKAMKRRRAKKVPMKLENTCFADNLGGINPPGTGDPGFQDYYINAAHIMSMMNRKAFHQVDSKGHIINYGLQIQVFNCVNATTRIYTAPQGYPMENSVRAWHFARKERYEEAGFKLSDLGYGSRLRFALDKTQSDTNQSTGAYNIGPSGFADTIAAKGEWDWSDVIITPPIESDSSTDIQAHDTKDSFNLHLCGDHTEEAADFPSLKFESVGMIQSWVENTRGWDVPTDQTAIQPENPLAFARMSETSSLMLTQEVSDEQKQSPPYSNVDDETALSIFAELSLAGMIESAFPNPTTNDDIIVAPGGVAKVTIKNNHTSAAYPFLSLRIFEL